MKKAYEQSPAAVKKWLVEEYLFTPLSRAGHAQAAQWG